MKKVIVIISMAIIFSINANCQFKNNFGLKFGIVNSLNKIISDQPMESQKKAGSNIGIYATKKIKKYIFGVNAEYLENSYTYEISHFSYLKGVPDDFKIKWEKSYINYQLGILLGYQFLHIKSNHFTFYLNPQLSIYSYNKLLSGYFNFRYIDDSPYTISFDSPSLYNDNIRKTTHTIFPKFLLEDQIVNKKLSLILGISYEYYYKKLPSITNILSIHTMDNQNYYWSRETTLRPNLLSIYIKAGLNFKRQK